MFRAQIFLAHFFEIHSKRICNMLSFYLGYPKLVTVLHRNQHPQRKFLYLMNKSNGEGTFSLNRMFQKWLKLIFFNESSSYWVWEKTVFRKIKLISDLKKWLWTSKMPYFFRLVIPFIYKISKFPKMILISKQNCD